MDGIPPELRRQLRNTLLGCGSFASNDELRHVFVDERIAPWVDGLPQANSKQRRVDAIIDYLIKETRADTGENVLLLFVHVIRESTHPQKGCYRNLSDLAAALSTALQDNTNTPDRSAKTSGQISPPQSKPPPPIPPQKPSTPLAGGNGGPHSLAKPPTDNAKQKNPLEMVQQHAGKLFVFFFILSILGFLANIFTVFDLTPFQKNLFRLALIILAALSGLLMLVWNRLQRATSSRGLDFLLVALITVGFAWLTFQPDLSYVNNSCPTVRLTASPEQIKPGENAKLSVQADDPEHDALNYTWQATTSGLDKEGGPYDSPLNEYTAPSSAAGTTVKITAIVDDDKCGKQVSQETTIRIVLPDK